MNESLKGFKLLKKVFWQLSLVISSVGFLYKMGLVEFIGLMILLLNFSLVFLG